MSLSMMSMNVSSLQLHDHGHAPIYSLEISICTLEEKKKFKHFNVERPVKVCALTSNGSVPCTAAETRLAQTKLASFVIV